MAKTKSQGKSKNNRKTAGKRLGLKKAAGQVVFPGQIIIRQVGLNKRPGPGTYLSRNFSIQADRTGRVRFRRRRVVLFSGRSVSRVEVSVE